MSQFATDFIRRIDERLSVRGEAVDIGFRQAGYLFMASADGLATLQHSSVRSI